MALPRQLQHMPHKQPHVSTCCTLTSQSGACKLFVVGSLNPPPSIYEAQTGPRQANINVCELHALHFATDRVNNDHV